MPPLKSGIGSIVPPGEGAGVPLSIRYPKGLVDRLDVCAKETGNTRNDTIMHLLRWALTEWEQQTAEKPKR